MLEKTQLPAKRQSTVEQPVFTLPPRCFQLTPMPHWLITAVGQFGPWLKRLVLTRLSNDLFWLALTLPSLALFICISAFHPREKMQTSFSFALDMGKAEPNEIVLASFKTKPSRENGCNFKPSRIKPAASRLEKGPSKLTLSTLFWSTIICFSAVLVSSCDSKVEVN